MTAAVFIDYIKKLIRYDAETGILSWRVGRKNSVKAGQGITTKTEKGYLRFQIKFNGRVYALLAHRVAFALHHGEWPKGHIDHINGIKDDNRIVNLRDVDHRTNQQNRRCHRTGKLAGAHFFKRYGRWMATIHHSGKQHFLGYYQTEREAHNAYMRVASTLEGHSK